ncbi:NUDIX hydrolase [Actibacterium sp. 188UL27-1]|uniref:NUDIX hydrolase n=1 Tax=Actibacterium sp. 188UL27-1 TaxID=2786961 RepID=UPI00195AB8FF|nr:NUDIX domain-containing protein [Actibacterium sp. 188UL27-1]MBM7066806.1 NUDIX domain-containing protein [Actibacterium sp. 188UL27-1]
MAIWRPYDTIRVLALGLNWREGRLLASEVRDDAGRLTGVRPPGGGVEFGERWQDALTREFQEELEVTVSIIGAPLVMENIFTHEGVTGHEIVFATEIAFPPGWSDDTETLTLVEDNGSEHKARWFDLGQLDTGAAALFPSGLKSRLINR